MIEIIAGIILLASSALLGAIGLGERVTAYNTCKHGPTVVDLAPIDRGHHDYKVLTCKTLKIRR